MKILFDNGNELNVVGLALKNKIKDLVFDFNPKKTTPSKKAYTPKNKSRHNKYWTPEEFNQAVQLRRAGYSISKIASVLKRKKAAVSAKFCEARRNGIIGTRKSVREVQENV